MIENEILKLDKCVIKDTKMTSVNISVFLVARACFNDEMLIESLKIKLDDINDKELYWFDLYLGKKADNKTKIAIAYIEGTDIYLLQDNGEKIQVIKASYILSAEDYDKSSLISTHIW